MGLERGAKLAVVIAIVIITLSGVQFHSYNKQIQSLQDGLGQSQAQVRSLQDELNQSRAQNLLDSQTLSQLRHSLQLSQWRLGNQSLRFEFANDSIGGVFKVLDRTRYFSSLAATKANVLNLTTANGSDVCIHELGGIGNVTWNAETHTCAVEGRWIEDPAWTLVPTSFRLIVGTGVTLDLNYPSLFIRGVVDNYGTINTFQSSSSYTVVYGVINNFGTINLGASTEIVPGQNLGIVVNFLGGYLSNSGYITNGGTIVNFGTFDNTGTGTIENCYVWTNGQIVGFGTFRNSGRVSNQGAC